METNYTSKPIVPHQPSGETASAKTQSQESKESKIYRDSLKDLSQADENLKTKKEISLSSAESKEDKVIASASSILQLPENKKEKLKKLEEHVKKITKDIRNDDYLYDKESVALKAEESLKTFVTKVEELKISEENLNKPRFKDAKTGIRLERNSSGQLIALLNVFVGKGARKVVKLAVDLNTFEVVSRSAERIDLKKKKNIQNEIKFLKQLEGPEFVKILGTCTYEGKTSKLLPNEKEVKIGPKIGIIMEYGQMGNLRAWGMSTPELKTDSDTQNLYWNFTETLLSGLLKMEIQEIRHRDFKPENLLLFKDETGHLNLKIIDFGDATRIKDQIFDIFRGGTTAYWAPEYAQLWEEIEMNISLLNTGDRKHLEHFQESYRKFQQMNGDMWSAGLILFEFRLAMAAHPLDSFKVRRLDYYERLRNFKQTDIDPLFSKEVHKEGPIETIEDLNYRMLQVDPKKRISAKEAFAAFQKLKKTGDNFLLPESILIEWMNKNYEDEVE